MKNIVLIDYGAGNIASVRSALEHISYTSYTVSHKTEFENYSNINTVDAIILPGVGDGSFMMQELVKRDFVELLQNWIQEDKPLLGICVGAQILLSYTQESATYIDEQSKGHKCLNVIQGYCRSFKNAFTEHSNASLQKLKIPHMGWNEVSLSCNYANTPLFAGIDKNASFYFVHSFYFEVENKLNIVATTDYGITFPSLIGRGNKVFGTQFHPEKSGEAGLKLIDNFLKLT